jgi:ADYC domain
MDLRAFSVSCAVGLLACAVPETSHTEQASKCPPQFCGGNSPIIKIYQAFDFNLDGIPNDEGLSILGLSKNHVVYGLAVVDGHILGKDRRGNVVLQGSNLYGAKIWIESPAKEQYAITIQGVGTIDEVVPPYGKLETYVLEWAEVLKGPLPGPLRPGGSIEMLPTEAPPTAVCPEPPFWGNGRTEWDEGSVMAPYDSLVYEGDRFNPVDRTVAQTADDRWFNIGCAAHTLAKLRLTRNTIHTTKRWQNVQAALKMLSADYCGHGISFTKAGQPLVWRDRAGMTFWQTPTELEARWWEGGAQCINVPRLANLNDVLKTCPYLPLCKNVDATVWDDPDELITSGNY